MRDDVAINGATARDQHGDAGSGTTAGPSHLLPCRGYGPGISGQDRHFELADVDAELQGVGADYAQHFALSGANLLGTKHTPPWKGNPPLIRADG